jgi:hypothetical protein
LAKVFFVPPREYDHLLEVEVRFARLVHINVLEVLLGLVAMHKAAEDVIESRIDTQD